MKKTAVIYDKWLHVLGGGEVVALQIAKALLKNNYQIDFICTIKPKKKDIKKLVNLDFNKIKFIEIWQDQETIKNLTQNKDLFINCSFMDYCKGYAKKNIYYTHFPTLPYYSFKGKLLYEKIFLPITEFLKPYFVKHKNEVLFYYLKKKETYYVRIKLQLKFFAKSLLEKLQPKMQNCTIIDKKIIYNEQNNSISFYYKIKPDSCTIAFSFNEKCKNYASITKIYISKTNILTQTIYDFLIKKTINRFRSGIYNNYRENLSCYDVIFANSKFTQNWIKKYWKLKSKVLYPPVDLINKHYDIKSIKKEKIICSVGRFFKIGHGKKQEVLISGFKKLYDQGKKDWKLILIGGVDKDNRDIVKKLKIMAQNYPIEIITNAKRSLLEETLLKARIYWHATGYGENENKTPQKFEHFGISVIEAISAGCTAVVYNGGGLREISKIFQNHVYLFNNIDQLAKITNEIIDNKLENTAIPTNLYDFDSKIFSKKLIEVIDSF